MKKVKILITVLLAVSLNAQDKTIKSQIEIKSGFNMGSFHGGGLEDTDYKTGFSAGVYGHFPLTDQLAIQPEVNYTRMGGKLKDVVERLPTTTLKHKNKTTLDYIQIPVMFKYYPVGSSFNIEVGPQIGYNIYASKTTSTTNYSDSKAVTFKEKRDIKNNVENFDFGTNFGLGYNVTDNLNVGVRYYMGLTKIAEKVDEVTNKKDAIKNHSFSIGVGYSF